jgi:RNA polymerase sigma-70 factor (ECF subfamily)
MEDPKSSVSDLTPWFDQAGTPSDPVGPVMPSEDRSDRQRHRPDAAEETTAPSNPGFLTDTEAFELLAVGMTDSSDAVVPATSKDKPIETDVDSDELVIVRNPGDGSVGNELPTSRIDRARLADAIAGSDADTDGGRTDIEVSETESSADRLWADCDDLPPLVVIPDEQRNHRRNHIVHPGRAEPSAVGCEASDEAAVGVDDEMVTLGRLPDPDEVASAEPVETDRAALARTTRDVNEIERIYEHYAGPVVAVAATLLSDQAAINETLYETFATAWRAASSFESVGPKGPWLFTLARRCGQDRALLPEVRGEERASGIYPAPSHRGESVAGMDDVWEAWEVRLALEQLPLSDRNVLRLIHYQGLIHSEIASELAIPVGTVRSRAYAGSRRLVDLLDHIIRPQAQHPVDDDLASALTWYLSGLADGSELDERQRRAVKRIQHQLASAPAWIQPAPAVRSRVSQLAAVEELSSSGRGPRPVARDEAGRPRIGSLGRTTVQYDMAEAEELFYTRGRHELPIDDEDGTDGAEAPRVPVVVLILVAVGLFALIWAGWRSTTGTGDEAATGIEGTQTDAESEPLVGDDSTVTDRPTAGIETAVAKDQAGSSASDTTLVYELMATDVDPEAKALVLVTPTAGGAEFELQVQTLEPTIGDQYLAAWLVNGDQWGRSGGQVNRADPAAQLVDPEVEAESTDGDDMPLAMPLGSFQWAQESGGFRFSSATVDDRFDTIVVTRQRPADPIGPSGPVVFFGSLGS